MGDRNHWTPADMPAQAGRTAVITGANSGIGFQTARLLAPRGATVVPACRDLGRARGAATRIRAAVPGSDVRAVPLDLASLASVRAAAARAHDAAVAARLWELSAAFTSVQFPV